MELKICHLYPDIMNLYGDRGNVLCMQKRLQWRGIESIVEKRPLGSDISLSGFDFVFIGSGQDFDQQLLLEDLRSGRAAELKAAINDGMPVLAISGGFELLGNYIQDEKGKRNDFVGALDMYTENGKDRLTGNYKFKCAEDCGGSIVVGFENHSGRTYLGEGLQPLGKVLSGSGNNGEDGTEGARYKNVFGTYSHGPVLPKNPQVCDMILLSALERKYGNIELQPLNDEAENQAHDEMCSRI